MKIKDIKEGLAFLSIDDMKGIRETIKFVENYCPSEISLEGSDFCNCDDECINCWIKCLSLEENQDKLENEI
ncbi:hypothetical protein ACFO6R_13335 [Eubacterium multiforme]|nr:hypothetical protein [Eubacterium multiforme]